MAFHDDLLVLADKICKFHTGKPQQATLKRAISTAYYALFHLLASESAATLGANLPSTAQCQLRRAFEHMEMKSACVAFSQANHVSKKLHEINHNSPMHRLVSWPLDLRLKTVAEVFVDLQEARHRADYDSAAKFSKIEAITLVEDVKVAFGYWKQIRKSQNAKIFLTDLALS